jgi:hypothetical protein
MLELDEIFKSWASSIDISNIRVIRSPSLIFLCGGGKSKESGDELKWRRDRFYKYVQNSNCAFRDRIVLAEDVFDNFDNSIYTDLLDFESHLAHLCSLTIIFSESPGSIAELGSFAVLDIIKEKLMVVLHSEDEGEHKSFIWRGPITHLQQLAKGTGRGDPIVVYPWKNDDSSALSETDSRNSDDLIETLTKTLTSLPKSEAWDQGRPEHVMLLILEILRVVHLGTVEDIFEILKCFGIQIDQRTIEKYLSLLVSLKYATKFRYGHPYYYFSESGPWISWAYTTNAAIRDQDRWASLLIEHYKEQQIRKYRALKSYRNPKSKESEEEYVGSGIAP